MFNFNLFFKKFINLTISDSLYCHSTGKATGTIYLFIRIPEYPFIEDERNHQLQLFRRHTNFTLHPPTMAGQGAQVKPKPV